MPLATFFDPEKRRPDVCLRARAADAAYRTISVAEKALWCDYECMSSNIEPLAREMTEHICRRNGMSETDIPDWVDLHLQCVPARLASSTGPYTRRRAARRSFASR
jgi:hypothetical protein